MLCGHNPGVRVGVPAYGNGEEVPRHGLLLSGEQDDSFARKAAEPAES
jgi:hypothetical protein